MKKILSMMLALLCIFALVSCGGGTQGGEKPDPNPSTELDVFAAAEKGSAPTKIVSLTSYKAKDMFGEDISFDGKFELVVNGNESIFDFEYEQFATVEDNADDYIVTKKGAIAIQGGKSKLVVGDTMGSWEAVIPSMQNVAALKIDKTLLPEDYTLSNENKKLSVSLTKEEALAVLGVVIDAASEITFEAESNGTFISKVVIAYKAASGAEVRIASSYTYGAQTLDFSRFN